MKQAKLYQKTNVPFKNGMPKIYAGKGNKIKEGTLNGYAISKQIGRPALNIDWDKVYRLAKIHATPEEIGWVLGFDPDSLRARPEFPTVYRKGWEGGKMSLRRRQFQAALGVAPYTDKNGKKREGRPPSVAMMIWLGKQILGQKDKMIFGQDDEAPLKVLHEHSHKVDYGNLSVDELETLKALLEKANNPAQAKTNGLPVIDVTPVKVKTKLKSKANGKVRA